MVFWFNGDKWFENVDCLVWVSDCICIVGSV